MDVLDPTQYEEYKARVAPNIVAAGGRYVVRGGDATVLEGELPAGRTVVLAFPTRQDALDWYHSEEYTAIKKLREAGPPGNALRRGRHGRNGVEELADAALITDLPGSASRCCPLSRLPGTLSPASSMAGATRGVRSGSPSSPSTSRWKWSSSHGSGRGSTAAPSALELTLPPAHYRRSTDPCRECGHGTCGPVRPGRGVTPVSAGGDEEMVSPSTTACSPPAPSGATPTSRSPTTSCATSSSPPLAPRAGRTASPSASSCSPTARWPARPSG